MEFTELQPEDDTSPATAAKNLIKERTEERQQQKQRNRDAYIRKLLKTCEKSLVDPYQVAVPTEAFLQELATFIANHELLGEILAPSGAELDPEMKLRVRNLLEDRGDIARGDREEPRLGPEREFMAYVEAAAALGVIDGYNDLTRYAPVQLETIRQSNVDDLDEAGVVGKVRLGATDSRSKEKARAVIPHDDCEHILIVAKPRQGKDSTGARLIGSLVDDHGYKAFSMYDDGRYETPMWAIPNDEEELVELIENKFGQVPKGYKTRVYIPATSSVPDELPANFEPFTLSVADLTPEIVMRLASVTSANADTRRRLSIAIDETVDQEGSVHGLIERIHDYADESEVTISVTELLTDAEADDRESETETKEISYQMDEDDYLREIARSLSFLAGEGLIGDVGADSNIDLEEAFRRQKEIAVLSCNHLSHKNAHIKQIFINVWLLMIHSLRDDDSLRIPRAVMGIREINYIAPSQFTRMKYKKIGKSLLHTLYFLSKQGGSRGMLMVGSTQKLNGVDKAIRQNMPIKIILCVGGEEASILDESVNFKQYGDINEEEWIQENPPGWGMLAAQGEKTYPIHWCPSLCGLSDKDKNWKDRYRVAAGARVPDLSGSPDAYDVDEWIDIDGDRHPVDDPPAVDEPYLIPEDLIVDGEEVGVDEAMAARQEYEVPSNIRFEPSGMANVQTTTRIQNLDDKEAQEWRQAADKWGVPDALTSWRSKSKGKRDRMVNVLRAIKAHDIQKHDDIAQETGYSRSTVANYISSNDELGPCVKQADDGYRLTPVGHDALEVPWDRVG